MPLPQRILGRDIFWCLETTGLIYKTTASRLGRRMAGRDTLIGSHPRTLVRRYGVRIHGAAVDARGRTVRFRDGQEVEPDAVMWATGFRANYSWIDLPVFDDLGRVRHRRGVTDAPGLYFLGLSWLHTRGSALIGWVKDDAEYLSHHIASFQGAVATTAGASASSA
jgi:putative flavoprotein involved in K+ transport